MEHGMMMESMGPLVLGVFHLEIFLMLLSGVFYLLCAWLLWKPYKEEKNELVGALMAFLVYQAFSMFFMGVEMHTMNMLWSNLAGLAVFIGSAYMLKFIFSPFAEKTRKNLFRLALIVAFGLFTWFMQDEAKQMELMHFTLWYDLVVNGLVVGGAIIVFALKTTEKWLRTKALGGGGGVVTCCVVANATMLSGAMLVSSFFQFLAPVMILGTLFYARKKQNQTPQASVQATPTI